MRRSFRAEPAGQAPVDEAPRLGRRRLEPEQKAWLEAQVVRQDVPTAQLAALADARAAAARQALVAEYGIQPKRLSLGPPVSDPFATVPGVTIALGALPRAAL